MKAQKRRRVKRPIRTLLRKAVEGTIFKQYNERIDRFNWNARLVQTKKDFSSVPIFETRPELYAHVNQAWAGDGKVPIDYLEFGVFEGASLGRWCELNKHPESRFFGFDSFQGLPETWMRGWEKGTFNTNGKTPDIHDSRVQFVKGWFQDSLPPFLASYAPKNRQVVHSDSDLYSSTLYCLTTLNKLLSPGTIILFDDFYDPIHEYRALNDYASAYRRNFRILAATDRFYQVAIELQ